MPPKKINIEKPQSGTILNMYNIIKSIESITKEIPNDKTILTGKSE